MVLEGSVCLMQLCVMLQGDNALMWASYDGHLEVTRYLLAHGVDPAVKDKFVSDDKTCCRFHRTVPVSR